MTTLEQNKTLSLNNMNHRSSSLGKVLDMSDIKTQKILKPTHKPSVSYHNFKVIHTISHKNSLHHHASGPINNPSFLPEINEGVPKVLSTQNLTKHVSGVNPPHLAKALKGNIFHIFTGFFLTL